jgi:regulatory protein
VRRSRGGDGAGQDSREGRTGPADRREGTAGKNPYALACGWLARRERCAAEVITYLRRNGVSDEEAATVLVRLQSERLVDDLRYARLYAEGRARRSPRSRRFLAEELRRRGVEPEAAAKALDDLFREVSEEELAERILAKLPRSGEDWKERAARRLRARGFRASAALGGRRASEDSE